MITSRDMLHIQKLQEQLELLRKLYDEKINAGQEFERVQPIQRQIRDLEKAIREHLDDGQ